ncbi:MAG: selenide, water dikinase SelD, partial [Chitinophagaceae bacterium]
TAAAGCRLYLTKPLGVGILSTAQKKGLLQTHHQAIALKSMTTLNKAGEAFGKLDFVKALTDVTGFGLLGHLSEMCEGSSLSAEIEFDRIPVIESLQEYLDQNCVPGGAVRNWKSYGHKVSVIDDNTRNILSDPQTSGGLLVAVSEDHADEFEQTLQQLGLPEKCCQSFGRLLPVSSSPLITVR